MSEKRANLFIISGPSGAGKSTVIHSAMETLGKVYFSVSMTTRAPRAGEVDGKDYFFVTEADFEALLKKNGFLEHARYVNNHYGSPKAPVEQAIAEGRDVIMDIEVQGARQVKAKVPEAVTIFLMPPSLEEMEKRLRGRGSNTEEQIQGRLARAREELPFAANYDYLVINDSVEQAARELTAIILAEKCRTQYNLQYLKEN